MPFAEFLQLLLVALIAGYVGYRLGKATASAQNPSVSAPSSPLPAPEMERRSQPVERPSGSQPPPVSAGNGTPQGGTARTPPRRSSAPPPAAAGLMKRD
jgi:hypothetical protein